jgi:hypothetical protein
MTSASVRRSQATQNQISYFPSSLTIIFFVAGPWDMNRDEAREAVSYFLTRLQALKEEVIVWPGPDEWAAGRLVFHNL